MHLHPLYTNKILIFLFKQYQYVKGFMIYFIFMQTYKMWSRSDRGELLARFYRNKLFHSVMFHKKKNLEY